MISTLIEVAVPKSAMKLYEVAAPLYRIHAMDASPGRGAHVKCRYSREKDRWGNHQLTDEPETFAISWGMRPLHTAMDGFVSLVTDWRLLKKGYRFEGFGSSFNYPGHTSQRGRVMWSNYTKVTVEDLLQWVAVDALIEFTRGCDGLSCSGRDHTRMREGEVLTEGGPTTSGAPPVFQRVW